MRRREWLFVVGGASISARTLHAQQKMMPVIGFLAGTSAEPSTSTVAAFHRGLSEAGYVVGRNVAIEYRWAEGHYDRLAAFAVDLADRKVDVNHGQRHRSGTGGEKCNLDDPDCLRRRRPDRGRPRRQSRPAGR